MTLEVFLHFQEFRTLWHILRYFMIPAILVQQWVLECLQGFEAFIFYALWNAVYLLFL